MTHFTVVENYYKHGESYVKVFYNEDDLKVYLYEKLEEYTNEFKNRLLYYSRCDQSDIDEIFNINTSDLDIYKLSSLLIYLGEYKIRNEYDYGIKHIIMNDGTIVDDYSTIGSILIDNIETMHNKVPITPPSTPNDQYITISEPLAPKKLKRPNCSKRLFNK